MRKSELLPILQESLDVWGDSEIVLISEIGREFMIIDAYQSSIASPFFLDIDINPYEIEVEIEDDE